MMLLIHYLVYTYYKHWLISIYYSHYARGGAVVEALHCKPEGRGFDSR
jgi:hypothetical protein